MPDRNTSPQQPTETNWHVITGAPCSGKTSVIESLGKLGHWVIPEAARAYIDAQLRQGATLDTLKADPLAFEHHLLMVKLAIEQGLPHRRKIYLDRALPDSIGYYRLEGLDPREPIRLSRTVRYRRVFLFEQLPFEKDAVRAETQQLAARIESLIETGYMDLGYDVIRVPVMSVALRTAFILNHT